MWSERTDPKDAVDETLRVLHGWEAHGVTQQKGGEMMIKTLGQTQEGLGH